MTQQNAPRALSRDLIARRIAYRLQEQRLSKLSDELRKLLDRLALRYIKHAAMARRHVMALGW
jgi:hypothetical protein